MFSIFAILRYFFSNHVRLAATTALLNSLEFTKANFDIEVSVLVNKTMNFILLGEWHLISLDILVSILHYSINEKLDVALRGAW